MDRVVVNDPWLQLNNWKVVGWHRRSSDHIPLSIMGDMVDWVPKPFHAFDDWIGIDEVQDLIKSTCDSHNSGSCFGILKEIKLKLKDWSKIRKQATKHLIKDLEDKLSDKHDNPNNESDKISIQEQLNQAYQNEVTQLKQKARIKWNIEGDGNTRFFHKSI